MSPFSLGYLLEQTIGQVMLGDYEWIDRAIPVWDRGRSSGFEINNDDENRTNDKSIALSIMNEVFINSGDSNNHRTQ
jgi:hypothetical protein